MKRLLTFAAIGLFAAACGGSSSSSAAKPDKSSTPAPAAAAPAAPKVLLDIPDGSGTKQTQKFKTSGDWDLAWSASDKPGGYGCIMTAIVNGGGGNPLAINSQVAAGQSKSDITHRHDAGEYYLDVNATCEKWTLKVTG